MGKGLLQSVPPSPCQVCIGAFKKIKDLLFFFMTQWCSICVASSTRSQRAQAGVTQLFFVLLHTLFINLYCVHNWESGPVTYTRTAIPFPWHPGMGTHWAGLGSSHGLKLDEWKLGEFLLFKWKCPLWGPGCSNSWRELEGTEHTISRGSLGTVVSWPLLFLTFGSQTV